MKVIYASSGLSDFDDYVPFRDGTRVVVTLPDGTQEGFTFYGQPEGTFFIEDYRPRFVADGGVWGQADVSQ